MMPLKRVWIQDRPQNLYEQCVGQFFNVPKNLVNVLGLWYRTNRLSSFLDNIRNSNRLQMSLQRHHYISSESAQSCCQLVRLFVYFSLPHKQTYTYNV